MFALSSTERGVLAALALASLAGAVATTPIVARSAAIAPVPAPLASPLPPAAEMPLVAPRRDPFAGVLGEPQSAPAVAPPAPAASLAAFPPIPGALRGLPPNAGALGTPPLATAPRITAVVAGRHPFALIDQNGTSRIVTIGDALGTSTVAAIRADGIALADGSHLALDPAPSLHGGP